MRCRIASVITHPARGLAVCRDIVHQDVSLVVLYGLNRPLAQYPPPDMAYPRLALFHFRWLIISALGHWEALRWPRREGLHTPYLAVVNRP